MAEIVLKCTKRTSIDEHVLRAACNKWHNAQQKRIAFHCGIYNLYTMYVAFNFIYFFLSLSLAVFVCFLLLIDCERIERAREIAKNGHASAEISIKPVFVNWKIANNNKNGGKSIGKAIKRACVCDYNFAANAILYGICRLNGNKYRFFRFGRIASAK